MTEMVECVAKAIGDTMAKAAGPQGVVVTVEDAARAAVAAYKEWEKEDMAREFGPSWQERLRLAQIVMRRGYI